MSQFQISGDLECLEEQLSNIVERCIEMPLDSFRSLTNKIPSAILNDYVFREPIRNNATSIQKDFFI